VDFYFDRDTSVANSGMIEMDNFKMAWYLIRATDLEVNVSEGTNLQLAWNTTDPENTGKFLIHRGSHTGFEISESTLIAETTSTDFLDGNLEAYRHYFYRVIPVHTSGEVFFPSPEVHGETYIPGRSPEVRISAVNSPTVPEYEKFEVFLDLENVGIENPYDPEDIDVYALFSCPDGKKFRINGFYDDAGIRRNRPAPPG